MKEKQPYLVPKSWSLLKPEEFETVITSETRRGLVERIYIEPPTLGKAGFGRLIVKWKFPRLVREGLKSD